MVYFICELGHEWRTPVLAMTNRQRGCPVCSGRKPYEGFNDLTTTHPHLISEWHPTKNGSLKPSEFVKGSNKRVWWTCHKCNHEWIAAIHSRAVSGSGCPVCKQSRGEKDIKRFLDQKGLKYIPQYKTKECRDKNVLPFDFAIFDEAGNVACLIEYDGIQHFKAIKRFGGKIEFRKRKRRDRIKNNYCKDNNIILIRIPYWKRDRIDNILTHWLKYYQIIK